MRKTRLYVGMNATLGTLYEVFRAEPTPTKETHPQYGVVIGPFRTRAGAEFCARFGFGNPHVQCVADAERLAKVYAEQERRDYDKMRRIYVSMAGRCVATRVEGDEQDESL